MKFYDVTIFCKAAVINYLKHFNLNKTSQVLLESHFNP